jgi:peptidylprolyl isomerase
MGVTDSWRETTDTAGERQLADLSAFALPAGVVDRLWASPDTLLFDILSEFTYHMKRFSLALILAAATLAASAQTSSKPSTAATPKKTTATTSKSTSAKNTTSEAAKAPEPWIKLPKGVPVVAHGPVKTVPIVVHYEDIKVGAGPVGEPDKMWHLKYTGYRAADGVMFDTWENHKRPKMGADGKPELGPDKKPVMGDAEPLAIPQGIGAVIPGFDFGLTGMKIGGKRRMFIPWQLAYGNRVIPDRPDHPGIPAKSDLIFDVELVEVTDMPQRPTMPMMPPHPGAVPPNGGQHPAPGATTPPPPPSENPSKPATPPPASTPSTPTQPQSK